MKSLLLSIAALAFVAPATMLAQKNGGSSSGSGATVIPGGAQSTTYVINKSGFYVLGGDRVMSDMTKAAIEINAADVTLDLNGFTLSFQGTSGAGVGVNVPTAVNVEVRNGTICHTPYSAVLALGSTGAGLRVIDIRVADTAGIESQAANTLVERCQVLDTRGIAVFAANPGTVVRNCQVAGATSIGIIVGAGSQVVGNVVNATAHTGISVLASNQPNVHGATVSENTVRGANSSGAAGSAGIHVGAAGCVVKNNHVIRAIGYGIHTSTNAAAIEGNTVAGTAIGTSSTGAGIYALSSAAVARNNTGLGNAGGLLSGSPINAGGNVGN